MLQRMRWSSVRVVICGQVGGGTGVGYLPFSKNSTVWATDLPISM